VRPANSAKRGGEGGYPLVLDGGIRLGSAVTLILGGKSTTIGSETPISGAGGESESNGKPEGGESPAAEGSKGKERDLSEGANRALHQLRCGGDKTLDL